MGASVSPIPSIFLMLLFLGFFCKLQLFVYNFCVSQRHVLSCNAVFSRARDTFSFLSFFFFFLKDGEFISDICGSGFSHFSKMLFMFLFFDNNVSYLSAAWRESRLGVGTQL